MNLMSSFTKNVQHDSLTTVRHDFSSGKSARYLDASSSRHIILTDSLMPRNSSQGLRPSLFCCAPRPRAPCAPVPCPPSSGTAARGATVREVTDSDGPRSGAKSSARVIHTHGSAITSIYRSNNTPFRRRLRLRRGVAALGTARSVPGGRPPPPAKAGPGGVQPHLGRCVLQPTRTPQTPA